MRSIKVKLEDEVFYSLIELKGKFQCKDWPTFFNKIVEKLK